jgi:hypothetical protein
VKLLPCPKCGPQGARLPQSTAFPEGEPYLSAGCVSRYRCDRCKSWNTMSRAQWAAVPELTLEDFDRLATDRKGRKNQVLANLPTKDLEGAGFTKDQARDLFTKGVRGVTDADALVLVIRDMEDVASV